MHNLKDTVISYLNMGLNPTVISFQDDGLFYLFDKLLKGKTISNSYDPVFTFVHVNLGALNSLSSGEIEAEINEGLKTDSYEGDTIMQTYAKGVETVCVVDDISFLDDVPSAIKLIDTLISKYRGILHFVYVVENPMLLEELRGQISPTSSFVDALMYQEIGKHWTKDQLTELCEKQFKKKLTNEELDEISNQSNNHLGIFKRLYKDKVLNIHSTKRYVELLIETLDKSLLNTFKKIIKQKELTSQEQKIFHAYSKVGFISERELSIPIIRDVIDGVIIPNKIDINSLDGKMQGLDLNELSRVEREIIETLLHSDEIITKSQIGDIIWKMAASEKYSEWAIDQRIARLRKKIIDLGFNIDVQTIYGQGYKLVFIDKK